MTTKVKRVQVLGGAKAALSSFIGRAREIIVDITENTLTVHDGVTPGGRRMLPEDGDASRTMVQAAGGTVPATAKDRWGDTLNVKRDFGAVGDGVTDDTAAFSAMISALNARSNGVSGGGRGFVPQSRYRIDGVLPFLDTNVSLYGEGPQATLLDFHNGSADCILIGDPSKPTRGQTISGMYLGAQSKTGGTMIKVRSAFNAMVSRVQSEANWIGIDVGAGCNSTTLEDLYVSATQGAAPICLRFVAGASNAARSDVLAIRNVVLTGQWSDATCFEWDGAAYTVTAHSLRMLHAKYGMVVKNTAADPSWYPSFLNGHDIEAEGFKQRALWIKAGAGFKITGSDLNNLTAGDPSQGAADLSAVQIDPDTGASYTRSIQISDTRIGGTQREGISIGGRDVALSNVIFYTTSYAGAGLYPVIRCEATSRDVQLASIRAEEFGGAARASYGVQIENGALGVQIANLDASYVQTAGVNNLTTSSTVSILNVVEPTGTGSGFVSNGNNETYHRKTVPGGAAVFKTMNPTAANNSAARFDWSTGIGNSYAIAELNNAGGTPIWKLSTGPAVAGTWLQAPEHHLTDSAGNDKQIVTSTGYALKVNDINLGAADASTIVVNVGVGATGDRAVAIDLIGDTTYADYGARLIRNGGANATTALLHRGTGALYLQTLEAAPIKFYTNGGAERLAVGSDGAVTHAGSNVVINANSLLRNRPFTLATLPSAAANQYCDAFVSDGAGGKVIVTSNGTNWKYPDGTTAV